MKKMLSGDYSPSNKETKMVHMEPKHKEIQGESFEVQEPPKRRRGRQPGWRKYPEKQVEAKEPAPEIKEEPVALESKAEPDVVEGEAHIVLNLTENAPKDPDEVPLENKELDAMRKRPASGDFVTHEELEAFRAGITQMIFDAMEITTPEESGLPSPEEPEKTLKGNGQRIKEVRGKWMASIGEEKPRMQKIFGSGYVRIWNLIKTLALTVAEQGNTYELDDFNDDFVAKLMDELAHTIKSHREDYIVSGRAKNVGRAYADKVEPRHSKTVVVPQEAKHDRRGSDNERTRKMNSLSDREFKQFFQKWAIQHHVLVYPDMRRSVMMESFEDYYRVDTGDLNEVMRDLFGEGGK
jgi:hypothetical protein